MNMHRHFFWIFSWGWSCRLWKLSVGWTEVPPQSTPTWLAAYQAHRGWGRWECKRACSKANVKAPHGPRCWDVAPWGRDQYAVMTVAAPEQHFSKASSTPHT